MLTALLCVLPGLARGAALGELTGMADSVPEIIVTAHGKTIAKDKPKRACPDDYEKKKSGDCWTKAALFDGEGEVLAYAHPAGWLVDPRCFADRRFTAQQFIDALSVASKKMDPAVSSEKGGCLGDYNPEWARELKEQVWSLRMVVQCPQNFDATSRTCADEASRDAYLTDAAGRSRRAADYYRMITVRNIAGCTVAGSSGLAGTLFHETLHGAGADSVPTEEHNKAWEREQIHFIYDRVYGTEATCFFGKEANIIQCRQAAGYHTDAPRYELCKGFSAVFTDMPPGFLKH